MQLTTETPSLKTQLIEFGLNPAEWGIKPISEHEALFTNHTDPDFIFLGTFKSDLKNKMKIEEMHLLSI